MRYLVYCLLAVVSLIFAADHYKLRGEVSKLKEEGGQVSVLVPQGCVYAFETNDQWLHKLHFALNPGIHKVSKSDAEKATSVVVHDYGKPEETLVQVKVGSGEREQTLLVTAKYEADARTLAYFDLHGDAQSPFQATSNFRDELEGFLGPLYAAERIDDEFDFEAFSTRVEAAWNFHAQYGKVVKNLKIKPFVIACY